MKSCDTPLSAMLIAIVVLGMTLMSLRNSIQSEEKVQDIQVVDGTVSLEHASFYLHSTIAQVLAAAFALVLVFGLPYVDHLTSKIHSRIPLRRKFEKSGNANSIHVELYDLGKKAQNFILSITPLTEKFVYGIIASLLLVAFTPIVKNNFWLCFLLMAVNMAYCFWIINSLCSSIKCVFSEYNDNILKSTLQFSDDVIEEKRRKVSESSVVFNDAIQID